MALLASRFTFSVHRWCVGWGNGAGTGAGGDLRCGRGQLGRIPVLGEVREPVGVPSGESVGAARGELVADGSALGLPFGLRRWLLLDLVDEVVTR